LRPGQVVSGQLMLCPPSVTGPTAEQLLGVPPATMVFWSVIMPVLETEPSLVEVPGNVRLSDSVLLRTVVVPKFLIALPNEAAELAVNVLLITERLAPRALGVPTMMPPPRSPVFPVNVERATFVVPRLRIPPPPAVPPESLFKKVS
jgi:hypothetical protein